MSAEEIVALEILEGSVMKELFLWFIREQVAPILNPFPMKHRVVILDNCSIHHSADIAEIIEGECGARLIFLPPYSPDFNPIEEAFAMIKAALRHAEHHYTGTESLPWLVQEALIDITADHCLGWMGDCGYL